MSGSTTAPPVRPGSGPARRVRHEVRDSLAVMLFSALVSSAIAIVLTVVIRFGN